MAQGIRQGTEAAFFLFEPKMCGKLVAKEVADWMAGKNSSPMLLLGNLRWCSLRQRDTTYLSSKPKVPLIWLTVVRLAICMAFS